MKFLQSILVFACLVSVAAAQVKLADVEKNLPKTKLEAKVGKDGKQELSYPHQNCPACKGKKLLECLTCRSEDAPKSCPECHLEHVGKKRLGPCYVCAATGALPNPLVKAPCPGCGGHSMFICVMCGGRGEMFFAAAKGKGTKCTHCKGRGMFPCAVCKGTRLVPSLFGGGKKLLKQKLKKLLATRTALKRLISQIEAYGLTGPSKLRKDEKRLVAYWKKLKTQLPGLKPMEAHLKPLFKSVNAPNLQNNERHHQALVYRFKYFTLSYLVHQRRVLDAVIARAEFNAKAGKKAP